MKNYVVLAGKNGAPATRIHEMRAERPPLARARVAALRGWSAVMECVKSREEMVACYRVTVEECDLPWASDVLRLSWRRTRKGVEDESRPKVYPTKRRGRR